MIGKLTQFYALFLLWFSNTVYGADEAVDIGAPTDGPLAKVGAFFQELVDFLGGAGVMFVVFMSAAAAVGLWVLVPKQAGQAIAWIVRVCIGALVLFGMGTLITWLKTF
ncbi:hypothetical protein [Candidatus Sororendozoicomonas aggregata]|uniref:hypothetical protein n=1 Tax=Candidatus Sororendozoicomonas aggregata TaxID=3073239 RepID=UPI002ED07479